MFFHFSFLASFRREALQRVWRGLRARGGWLAIVPHAPSSAGFSGYAGEAAPLVRVSTFLSKRSLRTCILRKFRKNTLYFSNISQNTLYFTKSRRAPRVQHLAKLGAGRVRAALTLE